MNEYLELMQLRKMALLRGKEELAQQLLDAAEQLVEAGLVSDDDIVAAAYI